MAVQVAAFAGGVDGAVRRQWHAGGVCGVQVVCMQNSRNI